MPLTKEQILAEAKALDPREREQLINDLRQMAGGDDLTVEQRAELRRRMEALHRGEAELIDGDRALREIREKLGHR